MEPKELSPTGYKWELGQSMFPRPAAVVAVPNDSQSSSFVPIASSVLRRISNATTVDLRCCSVFLQTWSLRHP